MTTIWKYQLRVTDRQVVALPSGAKILSLQVQYGEPYLWAEVDPSQPLQGHVFLTFGTGHSLLEARLIEYIGTYQLSGFVWHVYLHVNRESV